MLTLALLSLGGALQVLGVYLTARGVQLVREHFGISSPSRIRRWTTKWTGRAKVLLSRKPSPPVLVDASGGVVATTAINATARITFGPLDRSVSLERQVEVLDGWVRSLLDLQFNQFDKLELEGKEMQRELEAARQTQRDDLKKIDQSFRDLATGGLRLRSWSIFLIIAGTILLTIGSALAA